MSVTWVGPPHYIYIYIAITRGFSCIITVKKVGLQRWQRWCSGLGGGIGAVVLGSNLVAGFFSFFFFFFFFAKNLSFLGSGVWV